MFSLEKNIYQGEKFCSVQLGRGLDSFQKQILVPSQNTCRKKIESMLGHGEKRKKKKVQQAKAKSSIIEMNVKSQPGKFSDDSECDDTDQEKHGHFRDCIRFARLTGNVRPQHNCMCQPSDSHPLAMDCVRLKSPCVPIAKAVNSTCYKNKLTKERL